jgi:hypothetical protein
VVEVGLPTIGVTSSGRGVTDRAPLAVGVSGVRFGSPQAASKINVAANTIITPKIYFCFISFFPFP